MLKELISNGPEARTVSQAAISLRGSMHVRKRSEASNLSKNRLDCDYKSPRVHFKNVNEIRLKS